MNSFVEWSHSPSADAENVWISEVPVDAHSCWRSVTSHTPDNLLGKDRRNCGTEAVTGAVSSLCDFSGCQGDSGTGAVAFILIPDQAPAKYPEKWPNGHFCDGLECCASIFHWASQRIQKFLLCLSFVFDSLPLAIIPFFLGHKNWTQLELEVEDGWIKARNGSVSEEEKSLHLESEVHLVQQFSYFWLQASLSWQTWWDLISFLHWERENNRTYFPWVLFLME
jgi:hypothetical protein